MNRPFDASLRYVVRWRLVPSSWLRVGEIILQ